jgi:hypothetical protein
MNYSLFDDIQSFDEGKRVTARQAAAVAQKRVFDTVGGYLKIAKSPEEYQARLTYVGDDIKRIVADVAEEYEADVDSLQKAIEDHLEGDGITDLDKSLAGAPSAVGHGKQAGGHKDGCECGFCKNKGNLPVSKKDEEHDKENHDDDDGSTSSSGGGDSDSESSSVEASTRVADAPRDGGGAVKRESLPKGDGKDIGTEPSPKIDRKTWKPNALNDSTNTPPVDTEMSGSPHPTKEQDVFDDPDYKGDFLRDTDAVTTEQSLPSAGETGQSTERNISQEGQGGTWTEAQGDPVTSATKDPDANPLKAILDNGFVADNTVESAIGNFEAKG